MLLAFSKRKKIHLLENPNSSNNYAGNIIFRLKKNVCYQEERRMTAIGVYFFSNLSTVGIRAVS